MKKVAMFLAGAVGVAVVAMLLPANVFANCPNPSQIQMSICSGGGEVLYNSLDAGQLSGKFWIQGQGNDAPGVGVDSGIWSGAPGIPGVSGADGNWLNDFTIPDSRCMEWDWQSSDTDGCPDGSAPLWVVVSDSANRAMVASAGFVGLAGVGNYDFSFTTNGAPAPNFGGSTSGLVLGRAVNVSGSSVAGGLVTVTVNPLSLPIYDELGSLPGNPGGRALPGTVRLRGTNGGPVFVNGPGGGPIVVEQESDLCWEIVDGSYTATLGCIRVDGVTPSQNLLNAKASLDRGQLQFSWEVSAQFDVLGFNVIQKIASKGTERKVNDVLIPINGMNDTQAASYQFSAGRKDLKATRGGFEIEMVRLNGETSRTPALLR